MSGPDESERKITPLFPSHTPDEATDSPEPDPEDRLRDVEAPGDIDDASPEPDEKRLDDDDSSENNVVRVHFGAKSTPPTPEPPNLGELAPADQAKFKIFSTIIDEGMVMVTLNPSDPGVTIPSNFQSAQELRLNFCHQFQIPDFSYDPGGVRASLSFQGVRKFCEIPWKAVLMLHSHASGEAYLFDPDASRD